MSEFTDTEIIKLMDKLIGCTEPQGESALDTQVAKNIGMLFNVIEWYLDSLCETAKHRKSYMYSVKYIGEMAYEGLKDWKEMLEVKLEELE